LASREGAVYYKCVVPTARIRTGDSIESPGSRVAALEADKDTIFCGCYIQPEPVFVVLGQTSGAEIAAAGSADSRIAGNVFDPDLIVGPAVGVGFVNITVVADRLDADVGVGRALDTRWGRRAGIAGAGSSLNPFTVPLVAPCFGHVALASGGTGVLCVATAASGLRRAGLAANIVGHMDLIGAIRVGAPAVHDDVDSIVRGDGQIGETAS
jgi:hypothetical protein